MPTHRCDLSALDEKLSLGKSLTKRQMGRLNTIRTIYEQQKYMLDNHTRSIADRIVNVSQPFVLLLVRGKVDKPVEFGAKLDISVVDRWTRLECCSFDVYYETGNIQKMVERFWEWENHYHCRILTDRIYGNREKFSYCIQHRIGLSDTALGHPKRDETRDKSQDYRDECKCVEAGRRFSLTKRCGMGLVTAKLQETTLYMIAMYVLVLSLRKNQCALLCLFACSLSIFGLWRKQAVVQWALIHLWEGRERDA